MRVGESGFQALVAPICLAADSIHIHRPEGDRCHREKAVEELQTKSWIYNGEIWEWVSSVKVDDIDV